MKSWYIILAEGENKCEFVSVSVISRILVLKWHTGVNVKIRIPNFKIAYAEAKDSIETIAYAVSSTGRNSGKPIKIVFK